jgi:hypothetical protein
MYQLANRIRSAFRWGADRTTDRLKRAQRGFAWVRMPTVSELTISPLPLPETVYFVVGHPKSGTTWVSHILNSHPEISCNYEGHFFHRNDGYTTLADALNSDLLDRWLARDFNHWVQDKNHELMAINKLAIQFYLQRECYLTGKQVVGDKSTSYVLEPIHALFPEAHIIHVIRDGRDVAVSMAHHRASEGERWITADMARRLDEGILHSQSTGEPIRLPADYLTQIANTWKDEVSICRSECRRYFPRQHMEIKFEELQTDLHASLIRMFKFLGASCLPDIVERCAQRSEFKNFSGGREKGNEQPDSFFRKGIAGDWKNVFRESDEKLFYSIAGDLLIQLGYQA